MTDTEQSSPLVAEILDDDLELTLVELCHVCRVPAERIVALVEEGLVEPLGANPAQWRFAAVSLQRVHCALRLQRDLGVNVAGAALAVQLLEELALLRQRLRQPGD